MQRYLSERLMTVEEAQRLSELHSQDDRTVSGDRRPSIWAWQSVSGAMSQTVDDEQVERVLRARRTDR